jgi:hypothetical protein
MRITIPPGDYTIEAMIDVAQDTKAIRIFDEEKDETVYIVKHRNLLHLIKVEIEKTIDVEYFSQESQKWEPISNLPKDRFNLNIKEIQ